MAVVAGWKSTRRSEVILDRVVDALQRHGSSLNSAAELRSVNISVKLRNNSSEVRAVVITVESEHVLPDAG